MSWARMPTIPGPPNPCAANPENQLRGAVSRAQGGYFEDLLDAACKWYEMQGIALIEKTPEPMRPVKRLGDGKYIAVYTKKAQPDYKGVLRGGRMVMFEAKHTDADRIMQSCVSDAQEIRFNRAAELGAQCFVIVSFGLREFCRVPWPEWISMRERFGHKYATPGELAAYRLPAWSGGVINFLEGML